MITITQRKPLDESYFVDENGCWIWTGNKDKNGYGLISAVHDDFCQTKTKVRAHRVFWERENGPMPNGLLLRHKCHVTSCVNPEHTQPGTPAENSKDMVLAGRSLIKERHPLWGKKQLPHVGLAVAESNRLRKQPTGPDGRFISRGENR